MQGIAQRAEPGQPPVERTGGQERVKNRVGDVARGVGDKQLFRKAAYEAPHTVGGESGSACPRVNLSGDVVVFYDRPGDKLREEGYVQQDLEKAFSAAAAVAVYIYDVGQALKGKKGDAYRQRNPRQGKPRAGQGIDGAEQKVRVLENA